MIGDITLDIRTHSLERMGKIIELTPKEFSLLLILAESNDCTKIELPFTK